MSEFIDSKESKNPLFFDELGRYRTVSMFYETSYGSQKKFRSPYTLKEDHLTDKEGDRISLKKMYLEMEDPTEYMFANTYFASWKHWKKVCASPQLADEIEEWREELEIKLRATGIKQMINKVKSGVATFQTEKWLADRGFIEKKAGRPTKAAVEAEKKRQARIQDEFAEDTVRLLKKP